MSTTLWDAVTWDIARTGGITAFILMTLSVAVGLSLSIHWQSARWWPRIINSELHNFLALLGLIFTTIHVLAIWIDPFTKFGWRDVFIPFVSTYHTFWMALGIVALYLGIAIGISTWLRPKLGYKWWRSFHYLTFLLYVLVLLHGIAIGSDTKTLWAASLYIGSGLLVGGLLIARIRKSAQAKRHPHPAVTAKKTANIVYQPRELVQARSR